ncbi:hypothetical protein Y032_0103g3541 [Ancylostoma ceylanicum]|uniref:Uncharacterized protein n=1 Tax=Ancylostoma ceylanicum TaxID=53326 RepID=A0A016TGY0_9BILA|nr:hypothetical protein Y032_0103g3541 [Ancylostoma ceylanicum]
MSSSSKRKTREAQHESVVRFRKSKSKHSAEKRSRKSRDKGVRKARSRKKPSKKQKSAESDSRDSHAKSGSSENIFKTMETQIGSLEATTQKGSSLEKIQSREARESAGLKPHHSSLWSESSDSSSSTQQFPSLGFP